MGIKTRLEEEAKGNSETAYFDVEGFFKVTFPDLSLICQRIEFAHAFSFSK